MVVVEKSEEGVKEQEYRVGVRSLPARSMMRASAMSKVRANSVWLFGDRLLAVLIGRLPSTIPSALADT